MVRAHQGPQETMKKIKRSREDKLIGGVCGGLGNHFDVDPIIFRIFFLLGAFSAFPSTTMYILMWILLPKEKTEP